MTVTTWCAGQTSNGTLLPSPTPASVSILNSVRGSGQDMLQGGGVWTPQIRRTTPSWSPQPPTTSTTPPTHHCTTPQPPAVEYATTAPPSSRPGSHTGTVTLETFCSQMKKKKWTHNLITCAFYLNVLGTQELAAELRWSELLRRDVQGEQRLVQASQPL